MNNGIYRILSWRTNGPKKKLKEKWQYLETNKWNKKAVLRGMFEAIKSYIKKIERFQINKQLCTTMY